MDTVYRSPDHPTDGELLERLLAREADPHLAQCAPCSQRAETIARVIDPLQDEPAREPFDELFYRRQAARIRARMAGGEGKRPRALPRLAWAGAAAAAVVAVVVALHGRAPVGPRGGPADLANGIGGVNGFASAQDVVDDRLLREIDDTLDEDPYDFDPVGG
jgi:hypothetical protein